MEWWERVRSYAKEQGVKQEVIAARLGISQGSVSNVLAGKRPGGKIQTIKAYADALGLRHEWVIEGRGPRSVTEEAAEQAEEADVFTLGRRVFEEWVAAKDPALVALIPEFVARAERDQAHRWSALVTAFDVAEAMIADFRAWRRGEWDREELPGVPYVRSR